MSYRCHACVGVRVRVRARAPAPAPALARVRVGPWLGLVHMCVYVFLLLSVFVFVFMSMSLCHANVIVNVGVIIDILLVPIFVFLSLLCLFDVIFNIVSVLVPLLVLVSMHVPPNCTHAMTLRLEDRFRTSNLKATTCAHARARANIEVYSLEMDAHIMMCIRLNRLTYIWNAYF